MNRDHHGWDLRGWRRTDAHRCGPAVIAAALSSARTVAGHGSKQPMLTIHERPANVDSRSEAGHWEGDPIVGKKPGLSDRHAR
jgi:IS30 family transposase